MRTCSTYTLIAYFLITTGRSLQAVLVGLVQRTCGLFGYLLDLVGGVEPDQLGPFEPSLPRAQDGRFAGVETVGPPALCDRRRLGRAHERPMEPALLSCSL
jgi:hypothetical protein